MNPGWYIVLSMMLFSLEGVLARYVELSALAYMGVIQLSATVFMLVYYLIRYKKFPDLRHKLKYILIGNFFLIGTVATLIISIRELPFGLAYFLHYLGPVFGVIFSRIFLKEHLSRKGKISLLLGIIGLLLVYGMPGTASTYGLLMGFFSGLAYGAVIVYSKLLSDQHHFTHLIFYRSLALSIFLFPFLRWHATAWYLVGMGLLSGILAPYLYYTGSSRMKASELSIVSYSEIIIVLFYSVFLFGDVLTVSMWIGGFFIIFAGLLVSLDQKLYKKIKSLLVHEHH